MSGRAFRFLHASDFHLERPLSGVSELPPWLVDLALECPYTAAAKVFDAALAEEVDLVLLAGELADPELAGPRSLVFLQEQFERLAARHIPVYWARGADRGGNWPFAWHWPENVRLFRADDVQRITHSQSGEPLTTIYGWNWRGDDGPSLADVDAPAHDDLFSIALGTVPKDTADTHNVQQKIPPVNYCALGGQHGRDSRQLGRTLVHYCGSPQGRSPLELLSHGCTIGHVSESGDVRLSFISTDVARWHCERIHVDERGTLAELQSQLIERARQLAAEQPPLARLISFIVTGESPLVRHLTGEHAQSELTAAVRNSLPQSNPPVWVTDVESAAPRRMPAALLNEESLLGDFARTLQTLQAGDLASWLRMSLPEDFAEMAAAMDNSTSWEDALTALSAVSDAPGQQGRLAYQVASLGSELLGAPLSDAFLRSATPVAPQAAATDRSIGFAANWPKAAEPTS